MLRFCRKRSLARFSESLILERTTVSILWVEFVVWKNLSADKSMPVSDLFAQICLWASVVMAVLLVLMNAYFMWVLPKGARVPTGAAGSESADAGGVLRRPAPADENGLEDAGDNSNALRLNGGAGRPVLALLRQQLVVVGLASEP